MRDKASGLLMLGVSLLLLVYVTAWGWARVRCDQACLVDARAGEFSLLTLTCRCIDAEGLIYRPGGAR